MEMLKNDKYKVIKDGTQFYKVIPIGKRKPIARFLQLSEAEKFMLNN